jgi:hypothetical protein
MIFIDFQRRFSKCQDESRSALNEKKLLCFHVYIQAEAVVEGRHEILSYNWVIPGAYSTIYIKTWHSATKAKIVENDNN